MFLQRSSREVSTPADHLTGHLTKPESQISIASANLCNPIVKLLF